MPRKAVTADTDTDQLQDVIRDRLADNITTLGTPENAAVASLITGGGVPIPEASTAAKGIIRIATDAETIDGLDGLKAVTPAGFAAAVDPVTAALVGNPAS